MSPSTPVVATSDPPTPRATRRVTVEEVADQDAPNFLADEALEGESGSDIEDMDDYSDDEVDHRDGINPAYHLVSDCQEFSRSGCC